MSKWHSDVLLSLMGNTMKGFRNKVNLVVFVHGDSPVMDCLHKLRFTRKSRWESMLVRENNVVGAEVFPRVAKDNTFHHLAQNTS